MEGLLSFLFIVGLLIAWIAQQQKRIEQEQAKKRVEQEKKRHKKVKNKVLFTEEPEDLVNRHLKGELEVKQGFIDSKKESTYNRIDTLSNIKKAIIWSEILGKPRSEKELE